jgi:hypothetical protein
VDGQRMIFIVPLMVCVMLAGHMAVGLLHYHPENRVAIQASLVMAVFISAFYATLYSFVTAERANRRMRGEVEASRRLVKTYEFYDAELRDRERTVRTLRHDFRHTLLHLEALVKEGDHDGVARRLADLSGAVAEMRPAAHCENRMMNALAAHYLAQATEKGIAFAMRLRVPENLAAPAAELSAIFGNALENSLKGAESMGENGYITFDARPAKDSVGFLLENNYRPGAYRKGSGMGLASIRTLCGKNGGMAEIEDEGGIFRLNIVLRME